MRSPGSPSRRAVVRSALSAPLLLTAGACSGTGAGSGSGAGSGAAASETSTPSAPASGTAAAAASSRAALPEAGPLVWSDDFDGPAGSPPDPASWAYDLGDGGWGNQELQTYTRDAQNVALDGEGHLAITARLVAGTAGAADQRWTSARVTTFGLRTLARGRVEVRAKVASGTGIWPAAWTLGQDIQEVGWPACGEIDVIEAIGAADECLQTVHGPTAAGERWYETLRTPQPSPLADAFHTYAADWDEDRVVFALDSVVTGSVERSALAANRRWPFDGPQYVLLNVAVGGQLSGPTDATTPPVATMLVDWVRLSSPSKG